MKSSHNAVLLTLEVLFAVEITVFGKALETSNTSHSVGFVRCELYLAKKHFLTVEKVFKIV